MNYQTTIEALRKANVINSSGEEQKLFEAADAEFEKHKSKITARTLSNPGAVYSDIYDDKGNQVIDLVQEGGGMWGIALVGYTYIMEKAGLRFNSLAGTSAGAINTMCLAAMPDSVYQDGSKSMILAQIIANHDYKDFVDRPDGIVKRMVLYAIKYNPKHVLYFIATVFFLLFSTFLFWMTERFLIPATFSGIGDSVYHYILITVLTLLPFVMLYFAFKGIFSKNFGINPGNKPRDFIKDILQCFSINTLEDLNSKMEKEGLVLRPSGNGMEEKKGNNKISKKVVLITSNLTHNRIVKFPEKAGDYFKNPKIVDPALFVRASMSIPLFFDCVCVDEGEARKSSGGITNLEVPARFVDGGLLSNFPIREFHSSTRAVPRFPTFGVRLGIGKERPFAMKISFWKYVGSFVNTFRGFYDNDFIEANKEIKMIVRNIDTGKISWLNFSMNLKDKISLFTNGAKAACDQLNTFNWEEYKQVRAEIHERNQEANKQINVLNPTI